MWLMWERWNYLLSDNRKHWLRARMMIGKWIKYIWESGINLNGILYCTVFSFNCSVLCITIASNRGWKANNDRRNTIAIGDEEQRSDCREIWIECRSCPLSPRERMPELEREEMTAEERERWHRQASAAEREATTVRTRARRASVVGERNTYEY